MNLAVIWAVRAAIVALLFRAGPVMTTLGADWDAWALTLSLFILAQVFRFLRLLMVAGAHGTDARGLLQAYCLSASGGDVFDAGDRGELPVVGGRRRHP